LAIFSLPEVRSMERVDLHIHSTASDGMKTPAQLVGIACENSTGIISITDHDTLDGLSEGLRAASEAGIGFIPGVELSVDLDVPDMTAHLLGYFPFSPMSVLNDSTTPLGRAISFVQGGRQRRNPRILEKLRENGIYISMQDVKDLTDGDVVGRPHIAQAMVDSGYVGSMKEAFNRFLGKGRPAYVERDRLPIAEAMELIRGEDGLPVMAHPGYIAMDSDSLAGFFRRMTGLGLAGIEVYYPTHSASEVDFLLGQANDLGLLVTGGTDYHGRESEASCLGGSDEGFRIERSMVEDFIDICFKPYREVTSGEAQ
jgi:predicted metal-dependent phosphoesterase TrpH